MFPPGNPRGATTTGIERLRKAAAWIAVLVLGLSGCTSTDAAHYLSPRVNVLLFNAKDQGLLYGPYHPQYNP